MMPHSTRPITALCSAPVTRDQVSVDRGVSPCMRRGAMARPRPMDNAVRTRTGTEPWNGGAMLSHAPHRMVANMNATRNSGLSESLMGARFGPGPNGPCAPIGARRQNLSRSLVGSPRYRSEAEVPRPIRTASLCRRSRPEGSHRRDSAGQRKKSIRLGWMTFAVAWIAAW